MLPTLFNCISFFFAKRIFFFFFIKAMIFLLLCLFSSSLCATIYVSLSGNDTLGCGSVSNPCAKLEFAVVNVSSSDDTIRLASGIYKENSFTLPHSLRFFWKKNNFSFLFFIWNKKNCSSIIGNSTNKPNIQCALNQTGFLFVVFFPDFFFSNHSF